ncbi:MAG: peptidoglycan DD-metalloendopeptidase family protein, partial [Myxococcota bacterium]
MHPIIRAALAVSVLAAVSSAAGLETRARTVTVVRTTEPTENEALSSVCPKGSLPDATGCVPFPAMQPRSEGPGLRTEVSAHRDRSGQWRIYEQIPRRPDRDASYGAYLYPVETPEGPIVLSGYDLDKPDPHQRRGPGFSDTGHGGVDLGIERGTPVRAIKLPHQRGDAEVVFVGDLFGKTVVTRHTIAEAGRNRDYLLIHGHLDSTANKLGPGAVATQGTLLGTVGDSGSEGRVHLHLEVRQVRDGVEPSL